MEASRSSRVRGVIRRRRHRQRRHRAGHVLVATNRLPARDPAVQAESHVVLFTYDGYHLVQAKNGGGDGMGAEALAIGPWERFRMLELGSHVINGDGTRRMVALQAHNGQYVGAVGGGGSHLVAEATQIGPWEHFYLNQVSG